MDEIESSFLVGQPLNATGIEEREYLSTRGFVRIGGEYSVGAPTFNISDHILWLLVPFADQGNTFAYKKPDVSPFGIMFHHIVR